MLIGQSLAEFNDNQWKLILEKITVPSPIACVPRPRLHALLEQSVVSCTSTIITGRAGSGKTTLAIDFAEKARRNVAWYKVDAAAVALVRAAGLRAEAESKTNASLAFLDAVAIPAELRGYVAVAVAKGFIQADNYFRPQNSLTRGELAHAITMLQNRAVL